jgi:hypothetical protein
MDLDCKFPLGWTFPGYPSMILLDGFWSMDEFGTLRIYDVINSQFQYRIPQSASIALQTLA